MFIFMGESLERGYASKNTVSGKRPPKHGKDLHASLSTPPSAFVARGVNQNGLRDDFQRASCGGDACSFAVELGGVFDVSC